MRWFSVKEARAAKKMSEAAPQKSVQSSLPCFFLCSGSPAQFTPFASPLDPAMSLQDIFYSLYARASSGSADITRLLALLSAVDAAVRERAPGGGGGASAPPPASVYFAALLTALERAGSSSPCKWLNYLKNGAKIGENSYIFLIEFVILFYFKYHKWS